MAAVRLRPARPAALPPCAATSMVRAGGSIVPLDGVLAHSPAAGTSGGAVGVRVARKITSRVSAEFSLDYAAGGLVMSDAARAGIETTRTSFVGAWTSLMSLPTRGTQSVSATATIHDATGGRVITTGAAIVDLLRHRQLVPYVALGVAIVASTGDAPSAILESDSTFGVVLPPGANPPAPPPSFHQVDRLTVRAVADKAPGAVLGGGVKYALHPRWGLRVDVRDHIVANRVSTEIDTSPALASTPPTAVLGISFGSAPALQFSTVPSLPSTLSVALSRFKAFEGAGTAQHVAVAAGVFWRF